MYCLLYTVSKQHYSIVRKHCAYTNAAMPHQFLCKSYIPSNYVNLKT